MRPSSAGVPDTASLGRDDLAILSRLRTIALILQAAKPARAQLCFLQIGLRIGRAGVVCPLLSADGSACLLLAEAAGWSDLLSEQETPWTEETYFAFVDAVHDRAAATELPRGVPPGLSRLLAHTLPTPQEIELLAQQNWMFDPNGIRPRLPDRPSAHEVLDRLMAAETFGGLGSGPLGLLAQSVAARLFWSSLP